MAEGAVFDIERDFLSARHLDPVGTGDADEAALIARAEAAAARRDLAAMLDACDALWRRDALPAALAPQYAGALRAEGRLGEAAAVLQAQSYSADQASGWNTELAEILAADGQFAAARAAAERAPDSDKAINIRRRAKWIDRFLKTPFEALSWADRRMLVEGCLLVGALRTVAERLPELLTAPSAEPPSRDDAVGLARAAHKVGLHAVARSLVERLHAEAPGDEAVLALRLQSLAMGGQPEVAAPLLAALPPLDADAVLNGEAAVDRRALRFAAAEAQTATGRLEPAIQTLGALVTADRRDYAALTALQRVMGDYVLGRLDLPWAPPRPPKIINVLPFFNEVALLEMRLREMGDWVDHFVVVEATTTFTGRPKPLRFEQLRAAYADRGDQLLHAPVLEMPACMDTAWARDFYQRDMGVSALAGLWRPDDIILITDADEIVDRRAFGAADPADWSRLANLRMRTSKFFLNYCADPASPHANRRSGAICRAETLARFGVTYVRTALSAARKGWDGVPSAGWHFSSIGDADAVAGKLNAYAHQEAAKAGLRDRATVSDHLTAIREGEYEPGWSRRPVDKRFPRYVREHQDLLAPLLLSEGPARS